MECATNGGADVGRDGVVDGNVGAGGAGFVKEVVVHPVQEAKESMAE